MLWTTLRASQRRGEASTVYIIYVCPLGLGLQALASLPKKKKKTTVYTVTCHPSHWQILASC